MITGFYAGILAIMLVLLVISVVRKRLKNHTGLVAASGVNSLQRAIRIHGNFIEMVPMVLIIMVLFEMCNFSPLLIHIFGVALVVSRILHLIGVGTAPYSRKGRLFGTAMALVLLAVGGLLLILHYVTGIIF